MSQPSFLTDFDRYLLGEGTHERAYEKMGAHLVEIEGRAGTHFAIWAPNARAVHLVGDFNYWSGTDHPLEPQGDSGVWAGFFPDIGQGTLYKYRLTTDHGVLEKSDPYAFGAELRPRTASVVTDLRKFTWRDESWMRHRRRRQALDAPLSVYEVHLGSWRRAPLPDGGNTYLSYRDLAHQLVEYVKDMGYTHIELLPISEHPLDASWGYQTVGYFAPTSRFGSPYDFQYFVDYCHRHDIGVIIDWVPAHFPKDAHGLGFFDGTHLYEHADPRQGEHRDWGTFIFNYSRNEVRTFLLSSALFWLDKYHIDGLRVDAVASMLYLDYSRREGEWIPNEHGGRENIGAITLLQKFNEVVHGIYPDVLTFAEESTAWPMVSRPVYVGGLGFDLKWNMGWMHDMLEYMTKDPIHRRFHQGSVTFSLIYAFNENFILPLSHDEVVHGKGSMLSKMPGDLWQKFANLRAFYGYMFAHPGKKLNFMGGEFGQWREWNHDDSLDWHLLEYETHQGLQRFVRDLNHLYRREPALYEVDFEHTGFEWIDFHDADNSIIAFLRYARDWAEFVVVVCNFTPVPRHDYLVGVPQSGFYREILNSDSAYYWGSNVGNAGGLWAEEIEMHGRPCALCLTLPPLSTIYLKLGELPEESI
ncbi:MAG: 1,4-alpha-glucan branching protein GlgB [Anaerolineae bacterium]